LSPDRPIMFFNDAFIVRRKHAFSGLRKVPNSCISDAYMRPA
jgi:hypothetical protein